jgi:di/tricarboxylate transporter
MTLEIVLVFALLGLLGTAFVKEWFRYDIVALGGFCILMLTGLISVKDAYAVFSNEAALTIAAMFVLSAALRKTGVIDWLGDWLAHHSGSSLRFILLIVIIPVATASAFVNNTPIVAIMMPLLLSLCRRRNIAPSKLLIPLSYASIFGGCCTLIGTSTNLVASGLAVRYGMNPIGMFELAWIGVPILVIGTLYLIVFGPHLLADRQSVSGLLSPDERTRTLCQFLIQKKSALVGKTLVPGIFDPFFGRVEIIEVRRDGARVALPLNRIEIRPFDRFLVSVPGRQSNLDIERSIQERTGAPVESHGLEILSTIEGMVVEGIVAAHSSLLNHSLRSLNFRQTFGLLVKAVHRKGESLVGSFTDTRLQFGDTLLLLGPLSTVRQMRDKGDILLLDEVSGINVSWPRAGLVLGVLALVISLAAFEVMPIIALATIGCAVVLFTRCIEPDEAYRSIDWSVMVMIFCMMGMGVAMEHSGAAKFLADNMIASVQGWVPAEWLPYVSLALIFLLCTLLTEIMSNAATVIVLIPIGISCAATLQVDPRPFIIAIAIAGSAAFASPIGYQTHTMVYGAGGYRFTDFLKVGIPLNLIAWATAILVIPRIWPF